MIPHLVFFTPEGSCFDGKMSHFEDAFGGVGGDFVLACQFAFEQGWGVIAYSVNKHVDLLSQLVTDDLVSQGIQRWQQDAPHSWRVDFNVSDGYYLQPFTPTPITSRSAYANWFLDCLRATDPDLLIDSLDPLRPEERTFGRTIDITTSFDPEKFLEALLAFENSDRHIQLLALVPKP